MSLLLDALMQPNGTGIVFNVRLEDENGDNWKPVEEEGDGDGDDDDDDDRQMTTTTTTRKTVTSES
jgi:hypothetical protein